MSDAVKNYITPAGASKLREELRKLLQIDRPEVVRTVSWAASNGDRSENGDYIYGKRRLREIDRRIRFLTQRLTAAQIVDPLSQKTEQIRFGATVQIAHEDGSEKTYQIVGVDEIDGQRGRVSWNSPMGRALLNSRAGDVVVLQTPRGSEELEIVWLRYEAISD